MSAFSSRTGGYKTGVFMLFLFTIVFLVGFSAPFWTHSEKLDGSVDQFTCDEGLWMICTSVKFYVVAFEECIGYGVAGFPGWFHAVRVMEGLCTIGLIIACIYALVTNCCRSFPGPRSRFLEIMAGVSGCLGFIGCMVYVGMTGEESPSYNPYTTPTLIFLRTKEHHLVWAFFLAAVGSGLVVIAAIVIAVSNKPVDVQPNTGGMVMTTVTTQPGVAPQPYVVSSPKAGYPAQ
ncbi:uncharacterized protein LOC143300729 [Babylonia areolata]|uniref:uncharacterized protein LOC143300729 n=1 Tax=Babylonia areolata TaxID=304850 RepID=UPI003FCF20AF